MMKKVSIIIPMQQHSYQTAVGLIKGQLLERYYTTVYYKKNLLYLTIGFLLPSKLYKRMQSRHNSVMTPYVKTYAEIWGLLFLFAGRIPILKKYVTSIRKILFRKFSRQTSNNVIKNGTSYVWGFDSWSVETFEELDKKNAKTVKILDMASTAAPTIQKIINEEYNKQEDFFYTFERNRMMYSDDRVRQYCEELTLADYFLSPSVWVTNSLEEAGIESRRILNLPHGVDIHRFKAKDSYHTQERLRFLFVGRVEAAKGIRYLFQAFKDLKDYPVELLVVGNAYTWRKEVENYSNNISYLGLKLESEIPNIYQNADIFILSSLWEGSALSMLEAMASGLPVIASSHSCAPDIIKDGKNGFVYNPYDIEALKKYILWFCNHREEIPRLGCDDRKTAESNTWEVYYKNVGNIILEIEKLENEKGC